MILEGRWHLTNTALSVDACPTRAKLLAKDNDFGCGSLPSLAILLDSQLDELLVLLDFVLILVEKLGVSHMATLNQICCVLVASSKPHLHDLHGSIYTDITK